jgi:hypothetical protein
MPKTKDENRKPLDIKPLRIETMKVSRPAVAPYIRDSTKTIVSEG